MLSGTLDQIFSSVGNGLILFGLAVVCSTDDFGRISLMFTLVAAAIGVLRGALGTPLMLTAGKPVVMIRLNGAYAMAASIPVGVVVGVVLLTYGLSAHVAAEAWLLAIALPFVLMQDVARYVAITAGRAHVAAVWDGVWCIACLVFLVLAWAQSSWLTSVWLVGGWVAFALLALAGLIVNLSVVPRFRGMRPWLLDGVGHRLRYGIDAGLQQVMVFVILVIAATFIDNAAAAALRGATAILAPLAIVASAIPLLVIPESARNHQSPSETWRSLKTIAIYTSVIALASGIILRFLPGWLGSLALGDTFEATRGVVLFIAAQYAVSSWLVVLAIHLKAQNKSAEALLVNGVFVAITLIAIGVAVAVPGTAQAVATAFLFATLISTIIGLSWYQPWNARRYEPAEDVVVKAGRHSR